MFAVLLPVKKFRHSKQRLHPWLRAAERELLARTMFEDVWAVLRESFVRNHLYVITAEPFVIERCREAAIPCRVETEPRSHSDSVIKATEWVMGRGVTSLLSIPIDTPAVTAEELEALAALAQRSSVVVVPSADGTGTNALLRTPPDAIAPRFGRGSCLLHVQEARTKGLSHTVFPVESLAADIDTMEDVERFLALNRDGRTARLLRQWLDSRQKILQGVAVCS